MEKYISRYCLFSSVVGLDINGSLSMVRAVEGDFKIFKFSNTFNTLGKYRFKLGSDIMLDISKTLIQATRILQCDAVIKTNTINTATDTDLAIQRNSVEFLRLDTALDNIVCSKGIVAGGGVKRNTLDSDGDSDVLFKRNDVQFMALDKFTEDTVEKEAIIRHM